MQENGLTKKPEIIVYQSADGSFKLDVDLRKETLWLNQEQMSSLFLTDRSSIVKHIKNIFAEEELDPEQTCAKIAQVLENGRIYQVLHYNLDMVISVGYRVNSAVATRFRQWATQTLKEYMIKGFVMDDKRLAEGNSLMGRDYFDDLAERVRHIRLSERKFYQKVQDIFSQTSYDYLPSSIEAKEFYATIQNKFHYAVTGQTAAEIITKRIDGNKQNAGLTNFKGIRPTVAEAKIAKNYMLEDELKRLYLISEQFLSFAELQVLETKGLVSHEEMEQKVKEEIARYQINA